MGDLISGLYHFSFAQGCDTNKPTNQPIDIYVQIKENTLRLRHVGFDRSTDIRIYVIYILHL